MRHSCTHLTTPRGANVRPRLLDIVVIALGPVICGAEDWADSEAYGHVHGLLSYDTFCLVLGPCQLCICG